MTDYPDSSQSIDNIVIIAPPPNGETISLNQYTKKKAGFFSKAPHVDTVILEDGFYSLSEPFEINTPLKIIAKNPGAVTLNGSNLPNYLLVYKGKEKLVINGIRFLLENIRRSNVILIETGELEMDHCFVTGGCDPDLSKQNFGAGVLLRGSSIANISNSTFTDNVLGICLQGQSSAKLNANKFTQNQYGIVIRDHAKSESNSNEYSRNSSYGFMVYDKAEVKVRGDVCNNNSGGFGFLFHAKAEIIEAESYENEYHGFFINDWSEVTLRECKSYSNEYSGIAIYAASNSRIEACEVFENGRSGFELGEEPKTTLINNRIHNNQDVGIRLDDAATAQIEGNEIFENHIGIELNAESVATVAKCKIYHNADGVSEGWQSTLKLDDNEIFENGEEFESDETEDDEDTGNDIGDFFARMFGSENISNDPNTVAIPLGHLFGQSGFVDKEEKTEFDPAKVIDIPQAECEALVDLFKNTFSFPWVDSTNWLSDLEVGNWFGVTVTDGHVTSIDLRDNHLTGEIPSSLSTLTHLEILILSGNRLLGSIPAVLGKISNLRDLALNTNQLTGSIPPELGNLTKLEMLSLYGNLLTGAIPKELGKLSNLTYLSLWENQLTGEIPPELGNLKLLKILGFNGNKLEGPIPPELGKLSELVSLGMQDNQLSGPIPAELGDLSNLEKLIVYNNNLTGSIPIELGNLSSIKFLYLHTNQLTGPIPPELGRLSTLEELAIYNNQLTGEVPPELGNLQNLKQLAFHDNQIDGIIPISFTDLANLEVFAFINTNLREPEDAAFAEWKAAIPTWLGVTEEGEDNPEDEADDEVARLLNTSMDKLNNEDYQGSINDATEALKIKETDVAYQIRAAAYDYLELPAEAISDLNRAISLEPDAAGHYFQRGISFIKLENWRAALSDLQTCLELTDDEEMRNQAEDAIMYLVEQIGSDEFDKSENDTLLEPRKTELAEAHINTGVELQNQGEMGSALLEYIYASYITPDDPRPHYFSFEVNQSEENWRDAIENLTKIIRLDPGDSNAYANRGVSKSQIGELDSAIADLKQAVLLDPKNGFAHLSLGKLYLDDHKFDLALESLNKAIDADSDIPDTYLYRATVQENFKDIHAAIADLQKYCDLISSHEVSDLTSLQEHIQELKKAIEGDQ